MSKEKISEMVERELDERNTSTSFGFVSMVVFIILFIGIGLGGLWAYNQYLEFNKNLSTVENTKDAVLGNQNNTKGNQLTSMKVTIAGKTIEAENFDDLKRKIDDLVKSIEDTKYTFELYESGSLMTKEEKKYKDFGYFVNSPQLIELIKNKVVAGTYEIDLKLSEFSYIDIKKINDFNNDLISKQKTSEGQITFTSSGGFTSSGSNYSFYSLQFEKGEIVNPDLDNPKDESVKLYFTMKKSDINERVEKLNKIYSKLKNLKINIEIKTKHNEKNLEKFREILKPAELAIGKEGMIISIPSEEILKGVTFDGNNLSYSSRDYFGSGSVSISPSETSVLVKKEGFFDLINPNVSDNYPSATDFIRVSYENGGSVDLSTISGKINAYVKYLFINQFEKEEVKTLAVDVIPDKSPSSIIEIKKVIGKTIEIKNDKAVNDIYNKKQLNSGAGILKIKDVNSIIGSYLRKALIINGTRYSEGDSITLGSANCTVSRIRKESFGISCPLDSDYNIISGTDINKGVDNAVMYFTNINENSKIYIYDESKTVSIDYYEREKNRENLLDTLKNYIIMDESIIQDIKYVGGYFELKIATESIWYIKSNTELDTAILYSLSIN